MKLRLLVVLLFLSINAFAGIEKIPAGSFIINMGITPQTIANGLRPYGLVYDMLQNFSVPVKWVINPNKTRDGIDFTYNQTPYRGGSFIVLAQYRTAEVNKAIDSWIGSGVVGENTSSELSVNIFATLSYAPRWTIDSENGLLVTPFFENAGIPTSAYGGSNRSSWKIPSNLTQCDDIFLLPHATPVWDTHHNLLTWNLDHKGAIWAACSSVSVLENTTSPDSLTQMNFLTTTGMVSYQAHARGTPPFSYANPADPTMAFMEKMDEAIVIGTENVYMPKPRGRWRPGVKLNVIDPHNPDIPEKSPGPAAVLAYGYGFDDSKRGLVMYEGGHFLNGFDDGTTHIFNSDHVAAQRACFNFSFLAVVSRQTTHILATINAASTMEGGKSYPINFSVPANVDLSAYTMRWAASTGTIAPGPDSKSIIFKPKISNKIKIVLLTLFFTDACGREFFITQNINIDQNIPNNGDVTVVKHVSANADGQGNDFLFIQNIELYPENEIQIYNRWGILVYETKNYDNDLNAFKGSSNRNGNSENVVDGVYYYLFKYKDDEGVVKNFKDYFILKR
ncbi:MAG: hypothetical protein JWN56_564 [Sphingobacteriales bacterium]|nr:hypothetical protein [Sphingobacteriales bacterium]